MKGLIAQSQKVVWQDFAPELTAAGPGQILIQCQFAGLNRADVYQSLGDYPAPPGASPALGLECSGLILQVGDGVQGFQVGDRVMALVAGGAFAEKVLAEADQCFQIPEFWDLAAAAVAPESLFTFATCAFDKEALPAAGAHFLNHGGSSGLGSFSLQLAKGLGWKTHSTARGADRVEFVRSLGVDWVFDTENKSNEEIAKSMQQELKQKMDLIIDHLGGPFVGAHLKILKSMGRLVQLDLILGSKTEVDFGELVGRRLTWTGSVLRSRPNAEKARLHKLIGKQLLPVVVQEKITPKVDSIIPIQNASLGIQKLLDRKNLGKICFAIS